MTVTLTLTPEQEKKLCQVAEVRNVNANALLQEMLDVTLARLEPTSPPRAARIAGLHAGQTTIADDFDAPLPDEFWLGTDTPVMSSTNSHEETVKNLSKDIVAEDLAQAHFRVEPGIRHIFRLLSPQETDPQEPIKLLQVTDYAMSGIVPVYFGPDPEVGWPYPMAIIEVNEEDYAKITGGTERLPHGWQMGPEVARPDALAN